MFLYDDNFSQSDVDFVTAQLKFYQIDRMYRLSLQKSSQSSVCDTKQSKLIKNLKSNNFSSMQERDESYENAIQTFFDVVVRGAKIGQIESMEYYCRLLSHSQTFDNTIFQNFRALQNKGNKKPRDNMALYAFYAWHALKGAVNLDADKKFEDKISLSNDYIAAQNFYNESLQDLLNAAQKNRNNLATEYLIEKTLCVGPLFECVMCDFEKEPIINIDTRPPFLYSALNNFRNTMEKLSQTQTNNDLKNKIQYALYSNYILFLPLDNNGQREYERILPDISFFFKDIQGKQNAISNVKDI